MAVPRGSPLGGGGGGNATSVPTTMPQFGTRLYVAAVPDQFSTVDIAALFSRFGDVSHCEIKPKRERSMEPNRNIAFVTFATERSARSAIEALDRSEVLPGHAIEVRWAKVVSGSPPLSGSPALSGSGGLFPASRCAEAMVHSSSPAQHVVARNVTMMTTTPPPLGADGGDGTAMRDPRPHAVGSTTPSPPLSVLTSSYTPVSTDGISLRASRLSAFCSTQSAASPRNRSATSEGPLANTNERLLMLTSSSIDDTSGARADQTALRRRTAGQLLPATTSERPVDGGGAAGPVDAGPCRHDDGAADVASMDRLHFAESMVDDLVGGRGEGGNGGGVVPGTPPPPSDSPTCPFAGIRFGPSTGGGLVSIAEGGSPLTMTATATVLAPRMLGERLLSEGDRPSTFTPAGSFRPTGSGTASGDRLQFTEAFGSYSNSGWTPPHRSGDPFLMSDTMLSFDAPHGSTNSSSGSGGLPLRHPQPQQLVAAEGRSARSPRPIQQSHLPTLSAPTAAGVSSASTAPPRDHRQGESMMTTAAPRPPHQEATSSTRHRQDASVVGSGAVASRVTSGIGQVVPTVALRVTPAALAATSSRGGGAAAAVPHAGIHIRIPLLGPSAIGPPSAPVNHRPRGRLAGDVVSHTTQPAVLVTHPYHHPFPCPETAGEAHVPSVPSMSGQHASSSQVFNSDGFFPTFLASTSARSSKKPVDAATGSDQRTGGATTIYVVAPASNSNAAHPLAQQAPSSTSTSASSWTSHPPSLSFAPPQAARISEVYAEPQQYYYYAPPPPPPVYTSSSPTYAVFHPSALLPFGGGGALPHHVQHHHAPPVDQQQQQQHVLHTHQPGPYPTPTPTPAATTTGPYCYYVNPQQCAVIDGASGPSPPPVAYYSAAPPASSSAMGCQLPESVVQRPTVVGSPGQHLFPGQSFLYVPQSF